MTKLSAVILAAVAFAAIGVDAASTNGPYNPSTPSKRVFSRANDFVYHQASRDVNDKRSDVYEREPLRSDSELSSRKTDKNVIENGIHAVTAAAVAGAQFFTRRRNEMEDSALSKRDDRRNEPERRLVGSLIAGAVGLDVAHHLYDDYTKSSSSSVSQATSTEATPTATPTAGTA